MNSYLRKSFLMSLRQSLVKELFNSTNGLGRKSTTYISPRILNHSPCCNHDVNHIQLSLRFYGSSASVSNSTLSIEEKQKLEKAKKRKQEPSKIVVITETNDINMMTLEEAGKLAKKKLLHLVEVSGQSEHLKTDKPVYKLVSTSQFYGEDWKTKKSKGDSDDDGKGKKAKEKEEKTVLLKAKTSEHDALIKAKSIKKFVEKGHVVRVLIGQSGDTSGHSAEPVFKVIENYLKGEPIRIVQKISKNSQIRFQVMPPKKSNILQPKKEEQQKSKSTEEIKDNNEDSDDDTESDSHKPREKT